MRNVIEMHIQVFQIGQITEDLGFDAMDFVLVNVKMSEFGVGFEDSVSQGFDAVIIQKETLEFIEAVERRVREMPDFVKPKITENIH